MYYTLILIEIHFFDSILFHRASYFFLHQYHPDLVIGALWNIFISDRPLEKEMATHPSVLAWRIPGTGEPGGLPSMGSHRVGQDCSDFSSSSSSRPCHPFRVIKLFLVVFRYLFFHMDYSNIPQLIMELCHNKPIKNWKYSKSKMHSIHLIYWTIHLIHHS